MSNEETAVDPFNLEALRAAPDLETANTNPNGRSCLPLPRVSCPQAVRPSSRHEERDERWGVWGGVATAASDQEERNKQTRAFFALCYHLRRIILRRHRNSQREGWLTKARECLETGLDGYSSLKPFSARRRHPGRELHSMGLRS